MIAPAVTLRVDARFSGPPGMVNGGFACGAVGGLLAGDGERDVEVTLRRPMPLEHPLRARRADDGTVVVEDGTTLVATARPADRPVELTVPEPVTAEQAHAAAGGASYYDDPFFPGCFVCGPARAPGDGLRIFPGPVPGGTLFAAPWTPDASVAGPDGDVRPEVVWAALDCPSGFAAMAAADLSADIAALLGRMTTRLAAPPRVGHPCQVVAWPTGRDGRKLSAGSAVLGPGGEVLAAARTVWLTVPRAGLEAT